MEKGGKIEISLLGTNFVLRSDESDEYLTAVYRHYRSLVNKIEREMAVNDPLKIAVIAGILACDEALKSPTNGIQNAEKEEQEAIEKIVKNLIAKIDNCGISEDN